MEETLAHCIKIRGVSSSDGAAIQRAIFSHSWVLVQDTKPYGNASLIRFKCKDCDEFGIVIFESSDVQEPNLKEILQTKS